MKMNFLNAVLKKGLDSMRESLIMPVIASAFLSVITADLKRDINIT